MIGAIVLFEQVESPAGRFRGFGKAARIDQDRGEVHHYHSQHALVGLAQSGIDIDCAAIMIDRSVGLSRELVEQAESAL